MTRTYEDGYRDAMALMALRLAAVTRWESRAQGAVVISTTEPQGAWMWSADVLATCEPNTPTEEEDTCE